MPYVAGIDFGTLSVRASIFHDQKGRLGSATAEYPLDRRAADPDHATQRHQDHLTALQAAVHGALANSGIDGQEVAALAMDTTGSTVIPVGEGLQPLDDYYVWCDHRAKQEALAITATAKKAGLAALDWCGGFYSSEWGWAKLLHWLRQNPEKRSRMVTAMEHCDLIAAVLCGITDPDDVPRSICAMGHKWMWNESLGGLPSQDFLKQVDPLLDGTRAKITGRYGTSKAIAGHLSPVWASKLGLKPGIPIPIGALDAHWDAIGAGLREGDVVNVAGTSTCVMAISRTPVLIPGVSGVVMGSIHPDYAGIEAGLSACGDLFDAIARRSGQPLSTLSEAIQNHTAGQTGLLRLCWDNGDRTILGNPLLGGITLGWNLMHTAADELFAAIEGTAYHTRAILDRMAEYGTPITRVIHAGGIPQRNNKLNQVYANVLNKPVLVPTTDPTSVGSAIFAFLAAGAFPTVEAAQDALCPQYRVVEPDPQEATRYAGLYARFQAFYFALGDPNSPPIAMGQLIGRLN